MSPYLRQVKAASGVTAVQVVAKERGVRRIVEHLGSAHTEAELAALMRLEPPAVPVRSAGPGPGSGTQRRR